MEGLVFVGGKLGAELKQRPIPKIVKPDDVLVRIKGAGICGTDIGVINGKFPIPENTIIGHEAAGLVEKIGDGCLRIKCGDRVGINPAKGCDKCKLCSTGKPNLCEKGGLSCYMGLSVVNGALTDYVVIAEELLFKIPDDLSFEKAVLCETMSTVVRGYDQMKPLDEDSKILVLGGGITGTLAASLLIDEGFTDFTVCQRSQARQENIRKQCAGFSVEVISPDQLENAYDESHGARSFGFDVIFESTGNPEAVENAMKYLKHGGKMVIFGCSPVDENIKVSLFEIFRKELTIVGSFIQPNTYERALEKIISLNRQNRLDFDVLKIQTYSLSDYQKALYDLSSKSITKAIIV